MVGCNDRVNEHGFEQTPRDGEGQGSLACYSPWGCKESETTERLNSNNECLKPTEGFCWPSIRKICRYQYTLMRKILGTRKQQYRYFFFRFNSSSFTD